MPDFWGVFKRAPKDGSSTDQNADAALSSAMQQQLHINQRHLGPKTQADDNNFVGGFMPPGQRDTSGRVHGHSVGFPQPQHSPGPLPVPPEVRMPKPQVSRTMQYAEAVLDKFDASLAKPADVHDTLTPTPHIPPRPHSDPPTPHVGRPPSTPQRIPVQLTQRIHSPAVGSGSLPVAASAPATPPSGRRRHSSSSSLSAAAKGEKVQCSGVTKAGKRCMRLIKLQPGLSLVHAIRDDEGDVEVFCHQHMDEVLTPSGFYSRKNNQWVKFDDWIPAYLQKETHAALRAEMEKAVSKSDRDGYIYTFEIRDKDAPSVVHYKVGRAVNLVKRIDQWSKQCGSKEQVLRGYWPGGLVNDDTMMRGRVTAGEPGPHCHRVERLAHLELADLVANTPYLHPDFPNIPAPEPSKASSKSAKKEKCPDCGTMHQEIFTFERVTSGRYADKEWDDIIKPVIEKWGGFTEMYL